MGEARRRRLMEKKAQRKVGETRTRLDEIAARQEHNWAEIDKLRQEFDNVSAEYQQQLWALCDIAGPEFFPKDDSEIARLYLDMGVFDRGLGESIPEELARRLHSRFASILNRHIHNKTGRITQGLEILKEAVEKQGDVFTGNVEMMRTLMASIYSQRMIHETASKRAGHYVPFTKLDWKKHMTPAEHVKYGKKVMNEFLHSHEEGLEGRALRALNSLNNIPEQGRKEVEESLAADADGDFAKIEEEVVAKFSEIYPDIDKADRAKAFMALFDMVRREMKVPYEDEDVDSVAYLVTERIFLKGYERTMARIEATEKIGGLISPYPQKEQKEILESIKGRLERQDAFKKSVEEMQAKLSGAALEAKESYEALSADEQVALKKVIEKMPHSLIVKFEQVVDEWLTLRGQDKDMPINFSLLFDAVNNNSELEKEEIEPELRLAFSYLVTEKLLIDGFNEAEKRRLEEEEGVRRLPAHELWSDSELTNAGRGIWEQTYKIGGGDRDVIRISREAAESWGRAAERDGIPVNEGRINVAEAVFGFTAKWAVHAFQRITTTHTYAAALMCTDASRDVLQDIEMQWHAFMVCLPNGLLKYYDEELKMENDYTRILVAHFDNAASIILLNQNPGKSRHKLVIQVSNTIADVLDVDAGHPVNTIASEEIDTDVRTVAKVRRIFILAKRLVTGLLLALQNQDNFKSRTYPARDAKKPRERDEPAHRVVFIGAPLKVDCRPQVADYISKGSPKRKGAPPAVQLLVRGHQKRQVVGKDRKGRKVIWIQPYWRGPEDAPILTRPKQVS